MATINHSSGADIIVPNNNGTTYRGLGGDDTYILSNSIAANAAITIVDTSGSNTIQLVDGLSVASTKFAADAVQLTLTNGAVVTINGASNFDFDLGGNSTAGTTGSVSTFAGFAAGAGVATLPASGSVAGASNVSVSGTSWSGGSATYSYTVSKDASQITEGDSVTYTVSSSSAVAADTSLTWTAIGSNNGSTVDKATATDIDAQSGTVTIPAGSTSATFSVTALADSIAEGIEGLQISVFSPESTTVSTSTILVNNAGASSSSQTFNGTTGVDNLIGASGADSFDFSTTGELNDVDTLDGGAGSDILSLTNGAATLTPNVENIETLNITQSGDLVVDLGNTASTFDSIKSVSGGANDLTVNNVLMPGKIGITNGTGVLTVNLQASATTGTNDTINIELAGAAAGADLAITDDSATGVLEAATINSISAANTLTTMALNGAKTLTVSGDQSLTLAAALEATVTTVDASAMTGALGLTLSADPATTAITITGSAGVDSLRGTASGADNISSGGGNDTITFATDGQLNALDIIDGGAGTDTVVTANAATVSSVLGGLSNVEKLSLTAADATGTFTTNTGPTNFVVSTDGAQSITFNDDYDQASTVTILGDTNSTDTITNNSGIALTVVAYSSDFVEADTTITGHATASDTIVMYANGAGDWDTDSTATITGIDNLTINSTLGVTGSYSAATTMDMGPITTPLTVVSNLSALDGTLTLDFDQAGGTVGTINYTGGANADSISLGTLNDTINSGAGNDTITSGTGVNTINSGDGVDTVNMGTGVDIIDAGAGNDIIAAGATDLLANDVVDGGDGVDQLTFSATGYTDESVFGGLVNVESIKGDAANGSAQALPFNANTSFSIIDASGAGDTDLTLSAGYTQDTTVKLGSTDLVNADNIINGGVTGANVNLTVTATDQGSFDTATIITGGTGTDTITLTNVTDTNVAGDDHMVLTNATYIDVLNIVDYTNGIDTTVTAGANAATAMTVNATTLDAGETLDFDGNAMTGALTINSGAGADALDGGTVNDIIYGNDGIDTIDGQENSATAGADAIYGGAGNDIINVSSAETEFSNSSTTTLVTDTVDGGAGTDTLAFGVAVTLTKAELANISNVEKLTLQDTSTITLSDEFLTNNPGVALTLAAGTISAGAGTTADPTITEAVTYTTGSGNIKITTGTGDDTFNTAGSVLNGTDTIDGGAGTDTIAIYNDAGYGASPTTGDDAAITLDIYHTNIEKITVVDLATDDDHDVTITINAAWTGTALTIDASSLDQNALSTNQEILEVAQNTADLAALTVTGGEGNDIITTGAGADNITGNGGIDTITTSAGNDSIYGGAGNDIIDPGAGKDYAEGGAGNDTFTIATNSHFEVSGGTETLDGGAGVDILNFTAAGTRDISAAEMGSVKNIEVINIASTTGNAATTIGLGDAFFANNNSSVTVNANLSTAGTTATTKVDGASVSSGSITLVLKGDLTNVADSLIGGAGDDILQLGYKGLAAASDQDLEANDVFTGNGGTDMIVFDTQADGTNGGEGAIAATIDFDNVTGVEKILVKDADGSGAAADTIVVTLSTAVTTANVPAAFEYDGSVKTDADDTQDFNYNDATSGDNTALTTKFTLTGGVGADSLYGAAGADIISGGTGADVLSGFGQADIITGGAGDDTIKGGDETALTGVGDNLSGGSGADIIDGNAGDDTIDGGDGADIITGGTGADIITGGSGADVFEIDTWTESGGTNIDTITDFTTGADVIKITITAAQIEAALVDVASDGSDFAATDLGDVTTFAEVEAILGSTIGEAVYVKDSNQLVIDANGDANINASDLRINLSGTTAYDDADVVYYITGDADTIRTYTLGDGADSIAGGAAGNTINGKAGNDTIIGGAGVDIIDGGAGNDSITDGDGKDIITGGAGNDIITLNTSGDDDTIVFVGKSTAAPYVGTNNGTDTISTVVAADTIFRVYPLEGINGGGGSDDDYTLDLTEITATSATPDELSDQVKLVDTNVAPASMTTTIIAGYIQTTTATANNYMKMADNGSGIIAFGDVAGGNEPVYIYWVDSLLDGDGTDVTAADVHLLVMTQDNLDLDTLTADNFDL